MYKFKPNSTVCFFGDSITHKGNWIRRIYEHYLNEGIKFEMYNCGVAGINATSSYGAMTETLLPYNPTDVVIMFGMNDIWHSLYAPGDITDENVMQRRFRIDGCINSIKAIAQTLSEKNVNLTFCTPTPYDDLADYKDDAFFGIQSALHEVGERVKMIAKNYGGHVMDFNTIMYNTLKSLYKNSQTFIKPDRVHPSEVGNEFMALTFLAAQGFEVEIPSDYDTLSKLAERPYSSWEEKRYEIEQIAKDTDFIEWCLYPTVKDSKIITEKLIAALPEIKTPFTRSCVEAYIDPERDTKKEFEKLVNHTKTVYEL